MKKSKLFIGLAVLLFAAIGAFATAKSSSPFNVFYYNSSEECVEGQVLELCPSTGAPLCLKQVNGAGPAVQIYASQNSIIECDDAYRP